MKYRMLSEDELILFEEDLKHFLISNGIHGEEWKTLNDQEPEKALHLVRLFSDLILQKVYEKLKVIEFRSKENCLVFKLDNDEIHLIGLKAISDTIDLSDTIGIHEALSSHSDKMRFFRQSKPYSKQREEEIHQMIAQGCVPSHEAFWKLLEKAINN
jgi:hypothetical protein